MTRAGHNGARTSLTRDPKGAIVSGYQGSFVAIGADIVGDTAVDTGCTVAAATVVGCATGVGTGVAATSEIANKGER